MIIQALCIFDQWSLAFACKHFVVLALAHELLNFHDVRSFAHVTRLDSQPRCFVTGPPWFQNRRRTRTSKYIQDLACTEDIIPREDGQHQAMLGWINIWQPHPLKGVAGALIYDSVWGNVEMCSTCTAESVDVRKRELEARFLMNRAASPSRRACF